MSLKEILSNPILDEICHVILGFCQKLSGKTYYPYQYLIGANIIKHLVAQTHEDITILLSRQSGKSTITAEVTAGILVVLPELAHIYGDELKFWDEEENDWLYPLRRFATNYAGTGTGGVRIGVYAPKEQQAQVIFTTAKGILEGERGKPLLIEMGIKVETSRGDTLILSNNSRANCETASETAHIESATHDLILLDEAQDITEAVIAKSIEPMKANTGGTMVYIGTCGTKVEDFFKTIRRNINLQQMDGVQRHFQFDYRYCSASNVNYKKEVAKQIDKRGFESDYVKMNYRLMWLLERGQFCTEDMMYGKGSWAGKGLLDPFLNRKEEERVKVCYAGIDFGKENDSTVVTILTIDIDNPIKSDHGIYYKKMILNWKEWYGDDYEVQYWEIIEFLRSYSVDKICIDATSQGDPIADRFSTYLTSSYIEPVKFSESKNSEMFKLVQQEIQAGRLKAPFSETARESHEVQKFVHQILELEKEYRGQYLKVKHPNERGAHDDYFSSLALAVWATLDASMPEIEEYRSDVFGKTGGMSVPNKMPNIFFTQ